MALYCGTWEDTDRKKIRGNITWHLSLLNNGILPELLDQDLLPDIQATIKAHIPPNLLCGKARREGSSTWFIYYFDCQDQHTLTRLALFALKRFKCLMNIFGLKEQPLWLKRICWCWQTNKLINLPADQSCHTLPVARYWPQGWHFQPRIRTPKKNK